MIIFVNPPTHMEAIQWKNTKTEEGKIMATNINIKKN
jgi:hypothetical protein